VTEPLKKKQESASIFPDNKFLRGIPQPTNTNSESSTEHQTSFRSP